MSDQLMQRLLATFKGEARERIIAIAGTLTELASGENAGHASLVERAFREAHSLKAAAGVVGQEDIGRVCHAMETALSLVKHGEINLGGALLAALQAAADGLDDFLAFADAPPATQAGVAFALMDALDRAIGASKNAAPVPIDAPPSQPAPASPVVAEADDAPQVAPAERPRGGRSRSETVRLSAQRLDVLLRQAEEMVADKMVGRELARVLDETSVTFATWAAEHAKRRGGLSSQGRLGPDENDLRTLQDKLSGAAKMAAAASRSLATKVDQLQQDMKQILTLPCESITQPLQRAVRDVARDQKKQVQLVVQGAEQEMDRRILEELRDPLLHLVRNSVDHGIELPDERVADGKPAQATITIAIAPKDGQRVEFVVGDDGRGISTKKIAAAATKMGLLTDASTVTDDDLISLIFHSGISTSPVLTDLSGRGLGMAIVRERVERLGGDISVSSILGSGTTFRIVVPLTLATYRGILVRGGNHQFVFPTLAVERVVALRDAMEPADGSRRTCDLGEGPIPVVRLRELLDLAESENAESETPAATALVLETGGRRVAVEVDSLVGDQEILVKPLGKTLQRVRNVQGATILATGEIAPILNIHDLLKTAAKILREPRAVVQRARPDKTQLKRILIAEDSITARSLLKNILESAGYRVRTAADGVEAWTILKIEPMDLLVSDVEMPRMNGFDLTQRIRADTALADMPVILVTALESRDDLERGVDVGANAYIRKGGFDQGQLLDAVRRFA